MKNKYVFEESPHVQLTLWLLLNWGQILVGHGEQNSLTMDLATTIIWKPCRVCSGETVINVVIVNIMFCTVWSRMHKVGDERCTFIPHTKAPDSSLTTALEKLPMGRPQTGCWSQTWGMEYFISTILLVALTVVGFIFSFCLPIILSMIASRLTKETFLQPNEDLI